MRPKCVEIESGTQNPRNRFCRKPIENGVIESGTQIGHRVRVARRQEAASAIGPREQPRSQAVPRRERVARRVRSAVVPRRAASRVPASSGESIRFPSMSFPLDYTLYIVPIISHSDLFFAITTFSL